MGNVVSYLFFLVIGTYRDTEFVPSHRHVDGRHDDIVVFKFLRAVVVLRC